MHWFSNWVYCAQVEKLLGQNQIFLIPVQIVHGNNFQSCDLDIYWLFVDVPEHQSTVQKHAQEKIHKNYIQNVWKNWFFFKQSEYLSCPFFDKKLDLFPPLLYQTRSRKSDKSLYL